ncbi:membrane protein insertase YidC [Aestuariibius insulae]|uniref:membrane protein insertase YidC n=1 Tax=Aestuariibius insulae TaxID=2058287 RepID=UPI00345E2B28
MDDQNKNIILASVLSFLVLMVWFVLFPPEPPVQSDTPPATELAQPADPSRTPEVAQPPSLDGTTSTTATPEQSVSDIEAQIGRADRIEIDTPSLAGSISLIGGRIDQLALKGYNETLEDDSGIVQLLSPLGTDAPYYALYGWIGGSGVDAEAVPGASTEWDIESGGTLRPGEPVVLRWDNGAGLTFRREIRVDDEYLFDITQSVENTGSQAADMAAYGLVARHGEPEDLTGFFILHEGVIRLSDEGTDQISYSDLTELDASDQQRRGETGGWIGFTDKYWMTTLVPPTGTPFRSVARYSSGQDIYQTEIILPVQTVAPGEVVSQASKLFAGAKEWEAIRTYENERDIPRFIDSIDWGWFFFLTKPIFALLHFLNIYIGNMGWSIIVLTLIIKAVLLPLAYKSYVSMAKMKELQPEMEKLKERAGDDRQQLQQGMMKLYKDNKVNPAAGCLPILLQIPIFFSLYKVIFVTIELRHAPWFGWIRDLSAPDPSSILNLFGLLPWGTPEVGSIFFLFSLGILPILLGISMWLQQKLNPAPTDPTQRMIFAWMPWVFMFMLGSFASGLVVYWIANNMITFSQQYLIMRSQGIKPDVFGNILGGGKKTAEAKNK